MSKIFYYRDPKTNKISKCTKISPEFYNIEDLIKWEIDNDEE